MIEFFLGGARSGKSRLAEARALASGKDCIYLATGQARDNEMMQRIARHQDDRDARWQTVEEPLALREALLEYCAESRCVLVDCLTLWLSNWLESDEPGWPEIKHSLLRTLPSLPGDIIVVSNEVGQGVVPMNALARRFVDESGWLHQELATLSDRVHFVVAGIPMTIKEN